jgi:hypothetical protein
MVEQRSHHLGIAEHVWPFAEGEIRGTTMTFARRVADEVEQQLTATNGKEPELIEDRGVHPG